MKCPKCEYLGFEDVERCRNCGYDFSLMPPAAFPELSLHGDRDESRPSFEDLALADVGAPADRNRAPMGLEPPARAGVAAASPELPPELPLFGGMDGDDTPLITRVSPPRAPLAVRRSTPELPRLRPSAPLRTPMLDLAAFDAELTPVLAGQPAGTRGSREPQPAVIDEPRDEPAGVGARAGAAAIDLAILAAIDLGIIYLTTKICGLTLADLSILPKGPLLAFLAAQNIGYLAGFTIGGQTLGKMAAGIKVVSSDNAALDFGRSVVRALVWVVLAVPAGLGFATALFGREHRGLHDRCAGTKVVRATT